MCGPGPRLLLLLDATLVPEVSRYNGTALVNGFVLVFECFGFYEL